MFLVKNIVAAGLALFYLLTVTTVNAEEGNPVAGREKSQLCQGCHGEFGISTVGLIPKLAGQYPEYIEKQIRNYWAGTRTHQIMNAMAATLNDDDLHDVAAYFAHQPRMAGDGSENNELGKKIFLHGEASKLIFACVNCHGIKGKGLDPNISMFPVIGGQHKDYLRKQLTDFRENIRTNSPSNIMNTITQYLTDAEIEAVADYVSKQ
jgi:cytochrome c553